ncbi:unnamed protein product [Camellia sinensis]
MRSGKRVSSPREDEAIFWATKCYRLSLSAQGTLFLSNTKDFSEVSLSFSLPQPLPSSWLYSQGSHAYHAPLGARRQPGRASQVTRLAIMSGTPFDKMGTPFYGTPFDKLGTPFEGAPLWVRQDSVNCPDIDSG